MNPAHCDDKCGDKIRQLAGEMNARVDLARCGYKWWFGAADLYISPHPCHYDTNMEEYIYIGCCHQGSDGIKLTQESEYVEVDTQCLFGKPRRLNKRELMLDIQINELGLADTDVMRLLYGIIPNAERNFGGDCNYLSLLFGHASHNLPEVRLFIVPQSEDCCPPFVLIFPRAQVMPDSIEMQFSNKDTFSINLRFNILFDPSEGSAGYALIKT